MIHASTSEALTRTLTTVRILTTFALCFLFIYYLLFEYLKILSVARSKEITRKHF